MLSIQTIHATALMTLTTVFLASGVALAQAPSPDAAEPAAAPGRASQGEGVGAPVRRADPSAMLPAITIDREAGHVDIDAKVVNRDVKWLELLLCKVGGREHETILATEARPSHVHLGLILLGLKPGQVQRGVPIDPEDPEAGYRIIPAEGPAVRVELLYHEPAEQPGDSEEEAEPAEGEAAAGEAQANEADPPKGPLKRVEAGAWVYDRKAERTLADETWLFTGSRFVEHEGKQVYIADFAGTLISLVHFGDDVLAPRNDLTNRTDDQAMGANTDVIPPMGTAVTVRLTPVKDGDQDAGKGEDAAADE
ncbi:MAG: YdjY domain-containing protein [Phycisphaeraceae bacterium]